MLCILHNIDLMYPLNSCAELNYLKLNLLFFNFFFLVFSLFFLYFRVFCLIVYDLLTVFYSFSFSFSVSFHKKVSLENKHFFVHKKRTGKHLFSVCLSSFSAVVQLFSFARLTSSAKPEAL